MKAGSLLVFCCSCLALARSELTISEYGYRDLIVSISPDIPADGSSQAIVDGLKVGILTLPNIS